MQIELKHPFLATCYDLEGLLAGCIKLSTFSRRLVKQAGTDPDRHDPLKYIGDGFELFAEALIKLSPVDNRIGIFEYEVVTVGDTGVDGYGIGSNGNPATVQVKFRSDSSSLLTVNEAHLNNFTFASQNRYDVKKEDLRNMIIITNAEGVHHFSLQEMMQNKVHVVGNRALREMVDNNHAFWHNFRLLCEQWY